MWRGKGRGWETREPTFVTIQGNFLGANSFWFSLCSSPKAVYPLFKDENTKAQGAGVNCGSPMLSPAPPADLLSLHLLFYPSLLCLFTLGAQYQGGSFYQPLGVRAEPVTQHCWVLVLRADAPQE